MRSDAVPARPAGGARRSPPGGRVALDRSRLLRTLAAAGCPGPLRVVARTDSTQERTRRVAATAPEGWTILADEQTRGRGRSGHGWWAPPRAAVLASTLWRPNRPAHRLGELGLVAGVAVAEALAEVGVPGIALKWPNDCLANGRKVAGVVLELAGSAGPGPAVVVGVGCNVDIGAGEWPPGLAELATSCAAEGGSADRTLVAGAVLGGLWRAYDRWRREGSGWAEEAWAQLDPARGQRVVAQGPEGPIEGTVVGLAPGGGLRLDTPGGPRVVVAGEVRHLRPALPPVPVLDESRRGA